MEHLTERDLACYVGTGVKVRTTWYELNGDYKFSQETPLCFEFARDIMDTYKHYHKCNYYCKYQLILRPLSDLTKPMDWNKDGKLISFIDYVCQKYDLDFTYNLAFLNLTVQPENIPNCPYRFVDEMHENHFDTGLDKNLWIDINTLEKEQQ